MKMNRKILSVLDLMVSFTRPEHLNACKSGSNRIQQESTF